jgi:hypothetical protein
LLPSFASISHLPSSTCRAYLYSQFAAGTLAGYDFTNPVQRQTDVGLLQAAIWYLEDETGNPGSNKFIDLVISGSGSFAGFGTFASAQANNGTYGAVVMNLTDLDNSDGLGGTYRQDMIAPTPEPITLLLMGFGSAIMGGGIKRLRRKSKKTTETVV